MKRRFRFKLACVLCTVILFMTNISATAFAGLDYETVEVEGEQFVLGGGQGSTFDVVQNQFTDGAEDDSSTEVVYSSYSILSEREKEYYDRIVSTPIGETEFTIEYSPYLTKEEFAAIDFRAILYAVSFDHPEIFWYHGYSYKYRYKKSTNEVMSVIYTFMPPYVVNTEEPVYAVEDYEKINTAMWDEFHRVAEELNLANRTRYSFVNALHEYLCVSADYVINNRSCFDPYGTLVEKECVCQGYSETFKMFCDYYGIPAVCITGDGGGPHMWNAVMMEDGLWYVMDITWDDGGDEPDDVYKTYFLISIYTTPPHSSRFDESHIPDVPSYKPELNYATKAYEPVDSRNFNATYNSCVYEDKQFLVLSQFTAPDHEICYNGFLVKDILFKTGEQFTTYDDKTWTVIIAGDIDGDGLVTNLDRELATTKAISDNTSVETLQDYANDVNGDGVIDVMDIMVIQLMHTGNANDFEL
ncbi:MAG: hypothetical protein IKC01_05570 [Clostridia bacterium]|nr:hypothetical protein [Clostridia bacterium]